ncbi:hypothetical protein BrL25_05555 [Brevibacillus laterosporus DSM 25]|nr:hypothetical protein BrL25_05555 [Brevibacillus laterosporus DSM 25]
MNKVTNTENFLRQSDQAAVIYMESYAVYLQYNEVHPDKITIIDDCVDIKDVKHFNNWLNNRPL